jgi:anti-anti-sigma factor
LLTRNGVFLPMQDAPESNAQDTSKKWPLDAPLPASGDQTQARIRRLDGVWIIDFIGDLTTFADQQVNTAYQQIPNECQAFGINFTQCDYINSAGIAVIINLATQTRRNNQHVVVYGLSSHYQKLFHMVGLSDYLITCDSEADAAERIVAILSQSPTQSS